MPRHVPCPSAAIRIAKRSSSHSKSTQRLQSPSRAVPSFPEAFAHVTADPSTLVAYLALPIGQLEVVPPSSDVVLPLIAQLLAGPALLGVPQFLDSLFHSFHGLRTHSDSA